MQKNKGKKIIVIKNLLYSVSANIISMLVSAVLLILLPNLLGETEYGYWQLYLFYTSYVGFFHFGIVDGIYLRIGGEEYNKLDRNLYASQFCVLTFFEIILATVIAIFASIYIPNVNKIHVIVLTCICMVIYIANNYMTYILQATNRIKPYAIVVMAEKMVFALYVGVCWVCKVKSFEVIAIGDIWGKVFAMAIALIYCKNIIFCRILSLKQTLSEMLVNLSIGSKLVLANVASMLITGIVRLAIEY